MGVPDTDGLQEGDTVTAGVSEGDPVGLTEVDGLTGDCVGERDSEGDPVGLSDGGGGPGARVCDGEALSVGETDGLPVTAGVTDGEYDGEKL